MTSWLKSNRSSIKGYHIKDILETHLVMTHHFLIFLIVGRFRLIPILKQEEFECIQIKSGNGATSNQPTLEDLPRRCRPVFIRRSDFWWSRVSTAELCGLAPFTNRSFLRARFVFNLSPSTSIFRYENDGSNEYDGFRIVIEEVYSVDFLRLDSWESHFFEITWK